MDEILYELREHSAGLNCGRWDYIFSFIKTLQHDPKAVLPDRSQVTMEQPNMRAYTQLAVRTCHRRGVHSMGGMAAQIPIKNDEAKNRAALDKVRADKLREVRDGHDGTWVAHPGLVPLAREVFEASMSGLNQLDRLREDVRTTAADLLRVPEGTRTEEGLRLNVRVGIQYIEAWLRGNGCVPLYSLMEDAATAEISRAQVWQWLHHGSALSDGRRVTPELIGAVIDDEMARIEKEIGTDRFRSGRFPEARALFQKISTAPKLETFLTLPAYEALDRGSPKPLGTHPDEHAPDSKRQRRITHAGNREGQSKASSVQPRANGHANGRATKREAEARSGTDAEVPARARGRWDGIARPYSEEDVLRLRGRFTWSTRSRGWGPSGSGISSPLRTTWPRWGRCLETRRCSK